MQFLVCFLLIHLLFVYYYFLCFIIFVLAAAVAVLLLTIYELVSSGVVLIYFSTALGYFTTCTELVVNIYDMYQRIT